MFFIEDSQDSLVGMAAAVDNLVVQDMHQDILHIQAVVVDIQVVVVHSQAGKGSQDTLGMKQWAAAADNSCMGCNLLAMVAQWGTASSSEMVM